MVNILNGVNGMIAADDAIFMIVLIVMAVVDVTGLVTYWE